MAYMQRAKDDHIDINTKLNGFTGPQRFYIAYAQNNCQNSHPRPSAPRCCPTRTPRTSPASTASSSTNRLRTRLQLQARRPHGPHQ